MDALDTAPPPNPPERGGVLLRLGGDDDEGAVHGFVPAEVAKRLTALSSLTAVPGARLPALGIALADGAVVTVLRVGQAATVAGGWKAAYAPGEDWLVPGADRALLCHLGGFDVALMGAVVVATGVFDAAPAHGGAAGTGTAGRDGVLWRGDVVPVLDVRALYAQAEAATWAARASKLGGSQPPAAEAVEEAAEDEGRRAILPGAPLPGEKLGGQR